MKKRLKIIKEMYLYDNIEERNNHIEKMKKDGFSVNKITGHRVMFEKDILKEEENDAS